MKPLATIAVALLLPLSGVWGQTTAHLKADTIALGDQTELVIRNAHTFPSVERLSQNGVIALGQQFDTVSRTQTTCITCFEAGDHVIRLDDDDSLLLHVVAPVVDTASTHIADIAPIQKVPYTFWEVFRWVLLALLLCGLGVGGYFLYKYRDRFKKQLHEVISNTPTDTCTPYERATQELEALRQRTLWQEGRVKEYYTDLTDIVRRFIEEATQINATDLTTDQTLDALASSGCDLTPLRQLLTEADMVKFAKSQPLPYVHDRAMQDARTFVEGLWQVAQPSNPDQKEATE